MFGSFQQSALRIEISASAQHLREALTQPAQLQQWLAPVQLSTNLPTALTTGLTYTSSLGPITIQHTVDYVNGNCLRLILSQGIDGFHEWMWGEGWVQSRLEGVSLLPLNLAQTASLLRLKQFLATMQ
jgi:hypothetical protein